jgi:DNA-binding response OmpR family regulator
MNLTTHIRLLLVDDEEDLRTVSGNALQEAGYYVQTAASGYEGWRSFQSGEPWDVAIVDRAMPGMGGEELAQRIKKAFPRTALIMITGAPEAIEEPLLFDSILAKPYLPSELLACVAKAVEGNSDRPLWSKLTSWLSRQKGRLRNPKIRIKRRRLF